MFMFPVGMIAISSQFGNNLLCIEGPYSLQKILCIGFMLRDHIYAANMMLQDNYISILHVAGPYASWWNVCLCGTIRIATIVFCGTKRISSVYILHGCAYLCTLLFLRRQSTSLHATKVGVFAIKQRYLEPCTLCSILSRVSLLWLSQHHTLISVQIILYWIDYIWDTWFVYLHIDWHTDQFRYVMNWLWIVSRCLKEFLLVWKYKKKIIYQLF